MLVPIATYIEPECEAALKILERRGYVVWRVRGYTAIDQGRNQLATDALARGFAETMWIDSDIVFSPDDVDRIRCLDLPICCGVYPKKGKRELTIHVLPGTQQLVFGEAGGLVEIKYAAAGFLHVRRNVYETLQKKLCLPVCNQQFPGNGMLPFFQPLIVDAESSEPATAVVATSMAAASNDEKDQSDSQQSAQLRYKLPHNPAMAATTIFPSPVAPPERSSSPWYLAEDFAFCHRARQCGFTIWADTRIRLGHIGSCQYSWEEAGGETKRFASYGFRLT